MDLVMKYYIRTANLERSRDQSLYKTDFAAKRCKTVILRKKSNGPFLPLQ